MGQFYTKETAFTHDEMDRYLKLTYLTEDEIRICYEKFSLLADVDPKSENGKETWINFEQFEKLPEFKVTKSLNSNPFRDRIFSVFSTNEEMSFEDYLNMMSVFSEAAPILLKCRYAFKIYKFDEESNPDKLNKKDITELVTRLIGVENIKQLEEKEEKEKGEGEKTMNNLVEKILEADIDKDGKIDLDEFKYVVLKSAEFSLNFCIRVAKDMPILRKHIKNDQS